MRKVTVLAFATWVAVVSVAPQAAALPDHWQPVHPCPDVFAVGARGSGETRDPGGSDEHRGFGSRAVAVLASLDDLLEPRGLTLAAVSVDYPALGVDDAARAILDSGTGYGASVDAGAAGLVDLVGSLRQACPRALFVLVGYSQGADVIRRAIDASLLPEGDDIAAIVLIADPRFDAAYADQGVNLRGSYVTSRRGIRAGAFTLPPAAWSADRSFSVCNRGDIVCQFSVGRVPVSLLGWRSARTVHESYDRSDVDPIVRSDVWPLLRERLVAQSPLAGLPF